MATQITGTVSAAPVSAAPVAPPVGRQEGSAPAREPEKKPEQQSPVKLAPKRDSDKKLDDVVKEMAQIVRRDLNFTIDDSSGRTVVKVVDATSNEVVRQIPSEEMLALAQRLTELADARQVSGEDAKGLLMTTRV